MQIRAFDPAETETVVALWEACGLTRPWNDPRKDIARKLAVQPELFLVAVDPDVVGTAMVGYDGHRGWIYYVAVHPARQKAGIGRALMERAEHLLLEHGCPKVNLQVRAGNEEVVAFYRSLGYDDDRTIGLGKRIIPDVV